MIKDSQLTKGDLYFVGSLVDRLHCGESMLFVAREIRHRLRESWRGLPKPIRREILAHAFKVHNDNYIVWKKYS